MTKFQSLQEVVDAIGSGLVGLADQFSNLLNWLKPCHNFHLLVGADFESYLATHEKVDRTFLNKSQWARMSIMSTAGMGYFAADRSVKEYADKIWGVEKLKMLSN